MSIYEPWAICSFGTASVNDPSFRAGCASLAVHALRLPSYWGFALNSKRVEGSIQARVLSSISRTCGAYTGAGAGGSGPAPG